MTNMIYRCPKCNEIVYRYKKNEPISDLLKGANIGLHMITCDRDAFDAHIQEMF